MIKSPLDAKRGKLLSLQKQEVSRTNVVGPALLQVALK